MQIPILFNISVLLDVQTNLPETSQFFVCPNGFGEHRFSNVYVVLGMHNFEEILTVRQFCCVLCTCMSQNSAADNLQVFHRNSSSISVPSKWMDGFGDAKVFLRLNARNVTTSFCSIASTFRPEIDT